MGSTYGKFRKHLQQGDEYAALQVFQNSSELRRNLDPNSPYGDSLQRNTALHLSAKHAMKPLLRIFLYELGGNPNQRNANNETALHLACQGSLMRSPSTRDRRTACVSLILQWRSPPVDGEDEERVDLATMDNLGNTALHHAAATGLQKCVELLANHGTPLFIQNKDKHTACDLAERNGYDAIASFLESKMVFSQAESGDSILDIDDSCENQEESSGLRPQDLQEAKDQLLVETSDMLHVPLFTAEALLRTYEWSRESLLEDWVQDPVAACQKAGVLPTTSALQYCTPRDSLGLRVTCEQVQEEYQKETLNSPARITPLETEILCEICVSTLPSNEEPVYVPCEHQFCRSCWEGYLRVKIQEGEAHTIMCPAFDCSHLVPVDIIEKIVSADLVRRYLQFDIEAFVESNRNMKWCPFPGCGRAVKLAEDFTQPIITIPNTTPPGPVSHAIDCGNGHYFCWECLGEAHAPCSCDTWREWHSRIAEIKPEELRSTCIKTEDAANSLWLVTNAKPCPNCKSPIQKNEGCNHMKCSKCKHDFCWMCLETWKKHSSATGGYFRCNRFDAVERAEEQTSLLISEAEARNKEMQELKRFVHYYSCYKKHEDSHKLEEPIMEVVQQKMKVLSSTSDDPATAEIETRFLEEAVRELLRARRVLCGSYVYGYNLEDNGYNKTIFEFMQNDLEHCAEKLSDMVARQHLQTPRAKIIHTASQVRHKRQEFLMSVCKGLIPPETPPSLRRSRRRRYPGLLGVDPIEDDELTQAILASLEDLDPNDPWVKDKQGRHTNLAAIYDWPDYDSDEEMLTNLALATSLTGKCSREKCNRPCACNPRTGTAHKYCSLRCMNKDKLGETDSPPLQYDSDSSMDLLIAIEMSKIQMLEESSRINNFHISGGEEQWHKPDDEVMLESPLTGQCSVLNDPLYMEHDMAADASSEMDTMQNPDSDTVEQSTTVCSSILGLESLDFLTSASPAAKKAISFFLKESARSEPVQDQNFNQTCTFSAKADKMLFSSDLDSDPSTS